MFVLPLGVSKLYAQSDSLADVFPLAIGNQWTYRYYTDSGLNGSTFWQETDSGRAIYQVVGKITNADSTRWSFARYRNLTYHQTVNAWDTTFQIRDTITFELIEREDGGHQLYRNNTSPSANRLDVFPFTREYRDTTMIERYKRVGASDTIRFMSRPPGSYYPNYRSLFTFHRGIGLVRYSYRPGVLDVWSDAEHYLLSSIITSVRNHETLKGFSLSQNYPNPFNPSTTINISLPTQSDFTLTIYDLLGREIRSYAFEHASAGEHSVVWDGKDKRGSQVGTGVYFYRLNSGAVVAAKQMLLLR